MFEYKKFTDFPKGTMYDILQDAYSYDARNKEIWKDSWKESDDFFYDNPEIAVACFIPNGYSGSESSIAPRDFIEWYMKQKTLRGVDIVLPYGNTLAP